MEHYINLRIRPDPEFSSPYLMNALFTKLHRALVELHSNDIGVSFPDVDETRPTLGNILRLHGSSDRLQALMARQWLNGMRDHLIVNELAPVPQQTQYRCVRRVQCDSSPERLRKRLKHRHNLTDEEALNRIQNVAKTLDLPFINLRSQSTGHRFRLFIRHDALQPDAAPGVFSCYGLATEATVPWF